MLTTPSHRRSGAVDAERRWRDRERTGANGRRAARYQGTGAKRWGARCITLKALTYAPDRRHRRRADHVAARTLGGVRNWDYRFCWLRDATFTLLALMDAGYHEEAQAWRDWLRRAVAGTPAQMQILYGLGGERRLTEWELPWLGL